MKKRRRPLFISILVIIPVVYYLFVPLTSDVHQIEFDSTKIYYRLKFLAEQVEVPDSITRPNIIVILADDLGKSEVSVYGYSKVPTPNIDSIAFNGALFNEGYITSPICSPSRAALMTGRYQQRFGYELQPHDRYPLNRLEYLYFKHIFNTGNWIVADQFAFPKSEDIWKQGLPPSEITLAELLNKHEYQTGAIGKWHLGFNEWSLPLQRGFDYHYGFYEAYTWYADTADENIVNQHHDLFIDPYIWNKGRTGNCAIYRNDKLIIEDQYLTDRIADEAVQYIDQNKEDPFFLYVPFSAPHTPFQAKKEYYDKFSHIQDRNKRVYYAMIAALDDGVGRIMDKLRDESLEENTIVFFLSDNGGATYTKATSNEPLKGGKVSNFEGGINIPFMVQWKGQIPPGQVIDDPVISLDIFATAAALANSDLPEDRIYDGVNLMPSLLGEAPPPHEALYWRSGYNKAIRKGPWKLILNARDETTFLYNLDNDKEESSNITSTNQQVITDLMKDLDKWEDGLTDPLWPRIMDYRFEENGEVYYFAM